MSARAALIAEWHTLTTELAERSEAMGKVDARLKRVQREWDRAATSRLSTRDRLEKVEAAMTAMDVPIPTPEAAREVGR